MLYKEYKRFLSSKMIELMSLKCTCSVSKVRTKSGKECWTLSSEQYIQFAVRNVEDTLAKSNLRLPPTKCFTPFTSGYHPAEDTWG